MGRWSFFGRLYTLWRTPSILIRTSVFSLWGSRWMSLARSSKAYCRRWFTAFTMGLSVGSSPRAVSLETYLSRLPRSTSSESVTPTSLAAASIELWSP
ncbi:MAG: hypothetical protein AO394_06930 [Candidatus Fermentibacter daniensis]|nr:MAG: hypothetical protein AO394_06930 [Candidatus Fermentibacter daniensis]KZD17470.1 MAG: hypothetical protein AO395_01840 [Candidatus Fermentibacter daniensis]